MLVQMQIMEFHDNITWTRGLQVKIFSDLIIIMKPLIFSVLKIMFKAPQPIVIQPMGT